VLNGMMKFWTQCHSPKELLLLDELEECLPQLEHVPEKAQASVRRAIGARLRRCLTTTSNCLAAKKVCLLLFQPILFAFLAKDKKELSLLVEAMQVPAHLPTYLLTCLPACLPACLRACVCACLPARPPCPPARLPARPPAGLPPSARPTCLLTNLPNYLLTCR
jgi:hypothetical protein